MTRNGEKSRTADREETQKMIEKRGKLQKQRKKKNGEKMRKQGQSE